MFANLKNIGRFAVLAAVCGMMFSVSASGQEESVLVEQKETSSDVETPVIPPQLAPPANQIQRSLPPPQRATVDEPAPDAELLPPQSTVKRPFMRPAVPRTSEGIPADLTADMETIPAPESDMPAVRIQPTPPIKYDTDGDARRMYRHSGEIELIMVTQNPADGCFYEIPLCIPACCVGEPTMSGGHGIFGRGVVEYCWPSSGFRAIVKFRHILGDVRVDYEGD